MSVVNQYTKELYRKFRYYATWLPGKELAVGDVGKLNGRVFERETNLNLLGISFDVLEDKNKISLDYKSEGSVNISHKLTGETPIVGSGLSIGDAGITIEFLKKNSIVFKANGVLNHQIENIIPIKEKILSRYKEKKWEKDWVIVTELVVADLATILISSNSNTKIDFKAKANLEASELNLANINAGFSLLNSSGLETNIIAESELTPLFKIMGLKLKLSGGSVLATKGDVEEAYLHEIEIE